MRLRVVALIATVLVVAAPACSGGISTRSVPRRAGQFRLDEWSITADRPTLPAGRQTITAANLGHHTHELVIVKAADAASLPTKADGSVDESRLERVKVGEVADVAAGTSRQETMQLTPGSYVAFCNIVGNMGKGNGMMGPTGNGIQQVHYSRGMHTAFTVGSGS